jgi:hypothetical protein
MSLLSRINPITFLQRKMAALAIAILTKPVARYTLTIPNDMAALRRILRKGDVILIEGNERVSECIKYLTQSSWSHACIYVGDEVIRRGGERARELREQFADEAEFLVVEALVERGVVLTPISKYVNFNIRLCRPYGLTAADQREVVDHALATVGLRYDFKNVFDLMRYFLPVHLVPAGMRRRALQFGSGDPTRVICSSMIAECFERVRFPIVPHYEPYPAGFVPPRPIGLLRRFGRSGPALPGLLRQVAPSLVTPRDFDLSPYFAIVKFNAIENSHFNYQRLRWVEEGAKAPEPAKLEKSA